VEFVTRKNQLGRFTFLGVLFLFVGIHVYMHYALGGPAPLVKQDWVGFASAWPPWIAWISLVLALSSLIVGIAKDKLFVTTGVAVANLGATVAFLASH
jgi:hypothetical protein